MIFLKSSCAYVKNTTFITRSQYLFRIFLHLRPSESLHSHPLAPRRQTGRIGDLLIQSDSGCAGALCRKLQSFQAIWSICSNDFRKFGIIAKKEESTCILRKTIVKYKSIDDTAAIISSCTAAVFLFTPPRRFVCTANTVVVEDVTYGIKAEHQLSVKLPE